MPGGAIPQRFNPKKSQKKILQKHFFFFPPLSKAVTSPCSYHRRAQECPDKTLSSFTLMNSELTSLFMTNSVFQQQLQNYMRFGVPFKAISGLSRLCDKFSQFSSGSLNGDPMIGKTDIPFILLCMSALPVRRAT